MFTDLTCEEAAILIISHTGEVGNASEEKLENRCASKTNNLTSINIDSTKTKNPKVDGPKAEAPFTTHHKNISSEKVADRSHTEVDCVHRDGVNTTTSLDRGADENYAVTFLSSVAVVP